MYFCVCVCIVCSKIQLLSLNFNKFLTGVFTPVAGLIFGPLSTRSIDGFHFEDLQISRIYFVPNPNNVVGQVLLCARGFHTPNRGISFRRSPDFRIELSSFWKRDRENVFYKCSNSGQMFLRY